ncbi:MAG: hypothetical protein IRY91_16595, partial [Gemmatimonadaceae bacterium]|nr:hypothetical protein [Gemmatimonadaceae bacterium]
MPKVLVLLPPRPDALAAVADAIAEGARSVQYTEVDVRRTPPIGAAGAPAVPDDPEVQRYRFLDSPDRLADYAAVAVGAPGGDGALPPELEALFSHAAQLRRDGLLTDVIGSAFVPASVAGERAWPVLGALARLGMLLVPPESMAPDAVEEAPGAGGVPPLVAARRQGARIAK